MNTCWWCGKRTDCGVCMGPHPDYKPSAARGAMHIYESGARRDLQGRPSGRQVTVSPARITDYQISWWAADERRYLAYGRSVRARER